jgi:hypothetical protein
MKITSAISHTKKGEYVKKAKDNTHFHFVTVAEEELVVCGVPGIVHS